MRILLLAILLFLAPAHALAEQLVIATTTYCPLACQPEDSGREGVMHDVLKAAFEDTQYELIFKNVPYGRAIQETLEGKYGGVTFAGPANSPDFVFVRNFVMVNIVQFAVKKNSDWQYSGIESLKNIRIGTPRGFVTSNAAIDEYIVSNSKNGHVVFASNPNPTLAQEENLGRLLAGRLDAMLVGSLAFRYIASNIGVTDQVRLDPTPVAKFHNYLSFSPKHPKAKELRSIVEKKVDAMQLNGELDRIFKRYGLVYTGPK